MSIPFLTFTCDACEYSESSFVTFGQFLWNHDGLLFRFDRQLGLCQTCREIVAMEALPDPDVFERAREMHPGLSGQFVNPLTQEHAKCLASQEGFAVLERVMELNRPPVCLSCGGDDVQPLELPKVPEGEKLTDIGRTNLGVKHPGCGGNLMVAGSEGLRLGLNPVTYYYDICGKHLATLRGREGLFRGT